MHSAKVVASEVTSARRVNPNGETSRIQQRPEKWNTRWANTCKRGELFVTVNPGDNGTPVQARSVLLVKAQDTGQCRLSFERPNKIDENRLCILSRPSIGFFFFLSQTRYYLHYISKNSPGYAETSSEYLSKHFDIQSDTDYSIFPYRITIRCFFLNKFRRVSIWAGKAGR